MRTILIAVFLVVACSRTLAADAKMPPEKIAEEMKYAEELRKLGMDDLADTVIDRVPDQKSTAVILAKFQAFMHRHPDDEKKLEAYVRERSGDDPELYWMMKIRLADAYWGWGKHKKCLDIYGEFMKFYQKWTERSKEMEKQDTSSGDR